LEDNVNKVLAKLSDFRVRFDTQHPSADGDGTIEGLFITIINEVGEELSFENYSGGEKLKITVAISEALASLQKVGFRIFDETFTGLDEVSTENFASILETMQSQFGQVLCISHLPVIKDMFDRVITIRKHDGVSSVVL
jgi:DNA repair exonuclease SbcCD ATPase subunit